MMRIFIILGLCFIWPTIGLAQFSDNLLTGGLTIVLNPEFPAPGEVVTVSLDDYAFQSNGASIAWQYNGSSSDNIKNERSFRVVAPEALKTDTIDVAVTFPNGQILRASRTFTPRYLDVIVEPLTYTPQHYRGRALPVFGSTVRVKALLHGASGPVDSSVYTYTWKLNNTVLGGGPRKGAYETLYTVPHGRAHTLSIEVADGTGTVIMRRLISIASGEVDVQLHEDSPLYGLSHLVLPRPFNFIGNTVTLRAVPYNFDFTSGGVNSVAHEWRVNGRLTQNNNADPFAITLGREGNGRSSVEFKVRNLSALLQGGEATAQLQF
jgi:hypothetical protein